MPKPDSDVFLPLTDVVEGLREQIAVAIATAQTQAVRFEINSVELEFSVVAKREGGADAKIKFSILGVGAELGAAGKLALERTQKVKLSLTPISGVAEPGVPPKKLAISRKPPVKPKGAASKRA